jgi:hypothetical protein
MWLSRSIDIGGFFGFGLRTEEEQFSALGKLVPRGAGKVNQQAASPWDGPNGPEIMHKVDGRSVGHGKIGHAKRHIAFGQFVSPIIEETKPHTKFRHKPSHVPAIQRPVDAHNFRDATQNRKRPGRHVGSAFQAKMGL